MAKKQALYVALTSLTFTSPRGERVNCLEGDKFADADICTDDLASFVERGLLGGTGLAPKSEPPPDPEAEDSSDPPSDEDAADAESADAPEPPSTRPDAPKRRGRKPKSEPPPDPEA